MGESVRTGFQNPPDDVATQSFHRANWFDAVAHEVETVNQHVALSDLSVISKFGVTGPEARSFMETLGANTAPKAGRVGQTYALSPAGGVLWDSRRR